MTIDISEIAKYYQDLLIVQYNDRDKARETIALHVTTLLANDIISKVQDGYDIDTAVGVQLDVLGKYIGKDRLNAAIKLGDEDYRFVLKMRIVQNNSNHSPKSIDEGLYQFFEDQVILSDSEKMSIVYFVTNESLAKATIALEKEVLPRPMGVRLGGIVNKNKRFFSFTNYSKNSTSSLITGFTNYTEGFSKAGEVLTYQKVINL